MSAVDMGFASGGALPGAVPTRLWSEKHRGLVAADQPILFMVMSRQTIVSINGSSTSLGKLYFAEICLSR